MNARLDQYTTAERQSDKIIRIFCVNYCVAPLPAPTVTPALPTVSAGSDVVAASGDDSAASVKIVTSQVDARTATRPNSYLIKTKNSEVGIGQIYRLLLL